MEVVELGEGVVRDRRPFKWEDPSRVEVGQVWDYLGDSDEDVTIVVVDVRDMPPTVLESAGRRNATCVVLTDYSHHVGVRLSYSEDHMRRSYKRVS